MPVLVIASFLACTHTESWWHALLEICQLIQLILLVLTPHAFPQLQPTDFSALKQQITDLQSQLDSHPVRRSRHSSSNLQPTDSQKSMSLSEAAGDAHYGRHNPHEVSMQAQPLQCMSLSRCEVFCARLLGSTLPLICVLRAMPWPVAKHLALLLVVGE